MSKVFLLAGHSNTDPGAVGAGGIKEADLTKELKVLTALEMCNLGVQNQWHDNDNDSLGSVLSKVSAISTEEDIIVDLHFNSFNEKSTGVEVLVPENPSADEVSIATELCERLAAVMAIRNRGVKTERQSARGRLAVMRPKGSNILIEVCFISNLNDLSAYNSNKKAVAKAIAETIKKYLK